MDTGSSTFAPSALQPALSPPVQTVCVYCGAYDGDLPAFGEAARELGRELAERGLRLIYGGGSIGLMNILANAALAHGGKVTGVIPRVLAECELAHRGLDELHVVETLHERKALMAERADAFVALPGGYGTIEEFCEVVTWARLGLHAKPCGLLNVAGFYDPLLALFERAIQHRFVRPQHQALVCADSTVRGLLERMLRASSPEPVLEQNAPTTRLGGELTPP